MGLEGFTRGGFRERSRRRRGRRSGKMNRDLIGRCRGAVGRDQPGGPRGAPVVGARLPGRRHRGAVPEGGGGRLLCRPARLRPERQQEKGTFGIAR